MLDALAMAAKAGLVAAGFGKVETALAHDRVVGVIHAADAAADGMRKLDAAQRTACAGAAKSSVISGLTSAQLDLALGRSNVIHAALLAGPASDTFLARFSAWSGFGRRSGQLSRTGLLC